MLVTKVYCPAPDVIVVGTRPKVRRVYTKCVLPEDDCQRKTRMHVAMIDQLIKGVNLVGFSSPSGNILHQS